MKKQLIFLIIFVFSISINAQNTISKSYYENGNVKQELSFNDKEELDGLSYYYDINGDLLAIASYKNGKKDGDWKIWREDGSLAYEMFYKDGKKVGSWKSYDKEGNVIEIKVFK